VETFGADDFGCNSPIKERKLTWWKTKNRESITNSDWFANTRFVGFYGWDRSPIRLCLNTFDREDLRHAALQGTLLPLCSQLPEQNTQNRKKSGFQNSPLRSTPLRRWRRVLFDQRWWSVSESNRRFGVLAALGSYRCASLYVNRQDW